MMDASEDLARILADWHERRDQGDLVEPEAVIAAHSEYADELRDRFAAIQLMESRFPRRGPVPERIGEFHIVREIGRGGMGVVYEAEQPSMRRRVALKVLLPSVVASPRAVKRFQREAQATGALKHTNIVQVHQLGEEGGIWFTALELVDGRPLSDVLDGIRRLRRSHDGTHSPGEESEALTGSTTGSRAYYQRVAAMFADVADALDVAHEHGVVHRDIKPSNLLLDREGNLKIVDFGLARLDDAAAMTMTGDVVGTPNYMSPEQILGDRDSVDSRTDVYSLGATLYEVFALEPPFTASTLPALVRKIAKEEPRSLRHRDRKIPRDLDTIVLKALEKDPRKRFASAGDMARELSAFAQGLTIETRRTTVVEKLWRKARRHKVRTMLLTTIALLAIAATVFGLAHDRESRRREQLEYNRLIEQAQRAMASTAPDAGDAAETLLANAAALRPEAPDAYFHRGLLQYRGLDACLEDIAEAERRGLSARTAALARAGALWSASRISQARAELDRAAGLPGGGAVDDWLEAVALSRQGRWSDALQLLDRALREASPGSTAHRSALLWRERARGALGDRVGQLEDLSALRQAGLDSVGLRARAAALWRVLGRDAEARRAFEELLAAAREQGSVPTWRELVQATLGDWRLEATAAAIEAVPDEAGLWVERSHALIHADLFAEAFTAADRAVELDSDDADAWMARAFAHAHGRRSWKARQDGLHALSLAPADASVQRAFVRLQILMGVALSGLPLIRQAREANPYDAAWAATEVEALRAAGQIEAGLTAAEEAIALQPASALVRLDQALLLAAADREEEATALLDDVLSWEGLASREVTRIAYLFTHMGRYDEALAVLDGMGAEQRLEPMAFVARGQALRGMGELGAAVDAVRQGLALQPRDASSRSLLVELLIQRDGYEAAVEAVDDWIAAGPREIWPRLRKGALLREAERPEEGLAVIEEALEIEPANIQLLIEYGSCCQLLSRLDQAYEASLKAIETAPGDPYLLANVGGAANNRGAYADGASYLERALAIHPEVGRWWSYLAVSYANLGRLDEAYRAAQRGVARDPQSPHGLMHLANIEKHRGRFAEALDLADRALALEDLDGLEPDIGATRAMLLCLLHRAKEALPLASDLARRWPHHHYVRVAHAHALQTAGHFDEALREHEAVLQLIGSSPLRARALESQARTLHALERFEDALTALEEAARLDGGQGYQAQVLLGQVATALGQAPRAVTAFEKALALQPEPFSKVHIAYLRALVAAGRGEKAVERARGYARAFPAQVDALAALGETLLRTGNARDAVPIFEKALETHPDRAWMLVLLSHALAGAGEMERFLELEPQKLAALHQWVDESPSLNGRHGELINALQVAAQRDLGSRQHEAAAMHAAALDKAAQRALELWPRNARFLYGHTLAAWYRAQLAESAGDWRGVQAYGREALKRSTSLASVAAPGSGLSNLQLQMHQACGRAAWAREELDALALHTRASIPLARDVLNSRPDRGANGHLLFPYVTQAAMIALEIGGVEDAVAFLQENLPLAGEQATLYGLHRASALAAAGRRDEAAAILRKAPDAALVGGNEFYAGLLTALHLRDAGQVRRIMDLNRDYEPQGTDRYLLLAWRYLGAREEARRVAAAVKSYVDAPQALAPAAARAAYFAAVAGHTQRARDLLADLDPADLPHAAMFAARAHAALGDAAEARRYLEHARKQRAPFAQDPIDPALAAVARESK